MARKVDPFSLAKLFDDTRDVEFHSIYTCECGEAVDELTKCCPVPGLRRGVRSRQRLWLDRWQRNISVQLQNAMDRVVWYE